MTRAVAFLEERLDHPAWSLKGRMPKGGFAFVNVHACHQAVRRPKDMQDDLIREDIAFQILYQLMNLNIDSAAFTLSHFDWFHVGDQTPPIDGSNKPGSLLSQ